MTKEKVSCVKEDERAFGVSKWGLFMQNGDFIMDLYTVRKEGKEDSRRQYYKKKYAFGVRKWGLFMQNGYFIMELYTARKEGKRHT